MIYFKNKDDEKFALDYEVEGQALICDLIQIMTELLNNEEIKEVELLAFCMTFLKNVSNESKLLFLEQLKNIL